METSLLKRLMAKATLAVFIGSQLAGCLTVPNNNAALLQSVGQIAGASQGASTGNAQAIKSVAQALGSLQSTQASQPATGARGVVRQTLSGPSPIGNPYARYSNLTYSSTEFQGVYSRFKASRSVLEANPRGYSQQQFFAFSGALTDLMRYVDAIEARKEGLADAGAKQHPGEWGDFYAESLAALQPEDRGRIQMGHEVIAAQITPERMEAFCMNCEGPSRQYRTVSATAPRANLPQIGGGTNTQRSSQARPGQASESSIQAAVMEDLKDLSFKEAFSQFADENSALLNGLKTSFTSRKAQALITAIPIVGNIINLGMLATGKNLDGSPMDSLDYAVAAIGVLPVAGNIASKAGQLGRVFATELQGAAAYAKSRPQIEYGLELMGSEAAEVAMENVQPSLEGMYNTIAGNAINSMPNSAAYAAQNNIKI